MDTIISYTTYIHTSQLIISYTNRQTLKYNLNMKKEKDISNRKHD